MILTMPRPGDLAWQARAACVAVIDSPDFDPEHDPFFPQSRGSSTRAAREVCARCEVRDQCRAYWLKEQYGVGGGTSERERRKLRRQGDYSIPDVLPAGPLRAALRRIAKESFATRQSFAGIRPLARHVAGRSDVTQRALECFIQDNHSRERVTLAWATKVCTALGRPDLPSQLWPEATEAAA